MFCVLFELVAGQVARYQYGKMRREAASLRIQKNCRMYLARNSYQKLCSSAVSIQTSMRGMAARNELKSKKQAGAALVVQVKFSVLLFWNSSILLEF